MPRALAILCRRALAILCRVLLRSCTACSCDLVPPRPCDLVQSLIVREHFVKAAELNPLDATTRYALGVWYFEVASLSWTMRKLAAAIFASPPQGTFEEALAHFDLAESISPGFYVRNRLMIAKCQQQLRDKPAARRWAALALELPAANHDDRTAAADAKQLLSAL